METIANQLEFDQLMHRYSKSLFGYLYRLTGDYHLAEDLLQETFYKVYLHISGIKEVTQIKSWMYRIAYNTFIDHCRKTKKVPLVQIDDFFASLKLEPSLETERAFLQKYELELIYKHLATMKELQQKAILLVAVKGFSYKEAAELLNVKLAYLKSLVFRGRRELEKRLRDEVKE
ncbi:sigma-70 family RNA polymerase sigma factor [Anoxybacteroides tepidamans]|uniref:sigma-70 family RNA polymerase sigma factor n=1 Tax=Anoxybacteroides tepidamans TaxID=265948 RepID=UPI001E4FF0E6|nr:sigma-70 family RNA polymerase sigma factor [Anoxybacillus tepidamans]